MDGIGPGTSVNLLDRELLLDPYPFFTALRRDAPVWQVPKTRVFLVATWDLVVEATSRIDDFSSNLTGILVRGEDGWPRLLEFPPDIVASAALATADPPSHGLHRKLAQPSLSGPAVARLEQAVTEAVDSLLAPLLQSGGGEVMEAIANPLPALAVSWMLGFPASDMPKIVVWGRQGGDLLHGTRSAAEIAALLPETVALSAYIDERIEAARAGETAGMTGHLARMIDEGTIDKLAVRNVLLVLVGAAVETTMSLIGNSLRLLASTPEIEAKLRREPDLIPAFIEESARLESPFKGHYRVVRRACRLGSIDLEAGDRLFLLWASANRDDAAIENPDSLDLYRSNPRRHLAYGHGLHFCLGAALARQEVRVVIQRLFAQTNQVEMGPDGAALVPSLFVRRLDRLDLRFN